MPTRTTPDPLALLVGERIRNLRLEQGLSLFDIAARGGPSKGHLSSIEHGFSRITLRTLQKAAQALRVEMFDLLTYPEKNPRHALIERTRRMDREQVAGFLERILRAGASRTKDGSG